MKTYVTENLIMHAQREHPFKPVWSSDRLDSPISPEVEAPYFDDTLQAWVLSRHADVLAAFRCSALTPGEPNSDSLSQSSDDQSARMMMRAETVEALSPARLRNWRELLALQVGERIDSLGGESTIDLINDYAKPLCVWFAAIVTGVSVSDADELYRMAAPVSASAAEPYDPELRSEAKSAKKQMQPCFHSGPETLRDAGFVALAYTMPSLLGNAWFALLQYPQQWKLLHRESGLTEQAIEELFRYAGLTRTLFRNATEDMTLNGCLVRKGDRIVLRLIAANRDPSRFSKPHEVDIKRSDGGHLVFGSGTHSCVGASLIRLAAVEVTQPLLQKFASAHIVEEVRWRGGSRFRSPESLRVFLGEE
jgi:cytochrome P450